MASDNTGKIKSKRNRTSKPYDKGQSFIGKIRSVLPQWISRVITWETSNSARSHDEETPQLLSNITESEFKRPHPRQSNFSNVSSLLTSQPLASTSSADDTPELTRIPFSSYQATNTNENGFNPCEEGRLDDLDDGDSVSTSGCSSMVPHFDRQSEYQQEVLPLDESALERLRDQLQSDVQNVEDLNKKSSQTSFVKNAKVRQSDRIHHSKKQRMESEAYLFSTDSTNNNKETIWSKTEEQSESVRPQQSTTGRRPSFNISAFGSPLFANKSRGSILNDSVNDSIYYPGKTTYGGSSSHRKVLTHSTAPYQRDSSFRPQVKVRSKNSEDLGLISSTAKKILQTLESMSTPLSDAQKIPPNSEDKSSSILSFTPSHLRRPERLSSTVKKSLIRNGPPINRILPPQKTSTPMYALANASHVNLQSNEKNSLKTADSDYPLNKEVLVKNSSDGGGGGKMKNRARESLHYSSKHFQNPEENEIPEVALPDVSLDVKSLPKIDFGSSLCADNHSTPAPAANRAVQSSSNQFTTNTSVAFSSDSTTNSSNKLNFTFSSPLVKDAPLKSSTVNEIKTNFTFTSPKMATSGKNDKQDLRDDEEMKISEDVTEAKVKSLPVVSETKVKAAYVPPDASNSPSFNFKVPEPIALKRKTPTKQDANVKPSELKSGTTSDYLKKMNENKDENGNTQNLSCKEDLPASGFAGFGSQFKPAAGTWECEMCMVNNESDADTCVACQSAKPATSTGKPEIPNIKSTFVYDDKFKPNTDVWECSTCMSQNKNYAKKCLACETPRPESGTLPESVMTTASNFFSLSKQFNMADKWECGTCLIHNDNDKDSCIACQSLKPTEDAKPAATTWECDTCLIRNKLEVSKCIACENPRSSQDTSKGTFTFGANSNSFVFGKSSDTSSEVNKSEATSKIESVFKSSIDSSSATTGGFRFGDLPEVVPASKTEGFVVGAKTVTKNSDSSGASKFTFSNENAISNIKTAESPASGFQFTGASAKPSDSPAVGFIFNPSSNDKDIKFASTSLLPGNASSDQDASKSTINDLLKKNESSVGKADVNKPADAFVFGAGTAETKQNTPKESAKDVKGGFMFGSSVPDKTPAGGFTFGSTTVSSSSATSTPISEIKLSFESSNQSSTATANQTSVPIFGSVVPVSKSTNLGGFTFGNNSTATSSAQTSSSNFTFGNSSSNTTTTTSGNFSFVSNTNAPTTVTSSSASSFGDSSAKLATTTTAAPALFTFGQPAAAVSTTSSSSSVFSFGSSAASAMTTSSIFSFGTPSANTSVTTSSAASTFSFGANSKSITSVNTAPISSSEIFTFGANASSNQPSNAAGISSSHAIAPIPSSELFAFGSTAMTNHPSNTAVAEKKPLFGNIGASALPSAFTGSSIPGSGATPSFGSTPSSSAFSIGASTTTPSSSFSMGGTTTMPSFSFGAPATTAASAKPSAVFAFGAQPSSNSSNETSSSNLSFGQQSANQPSLGTFGAPNSQPSNFGQTASTFSFGSSTPSTGFAANTGSTDSSSVFRFGGPEPSQQTMFAAPQQPAAASTGGFNFNPSAAASTGFTPQPFQFQPTGADNPFSVPPSQQNANNRRIKRAQRRIKK